MLWTWMVVVVGLARAETAVSVDAVSVDGLEVRALSCKLQSGGLLASVMVVGALAKQKAVLDACAPQGAAFRIHWTWAGGATAVGTVSGSEPGKVDCITRALTPIPAPSAGTCSAVLLVGQPEAAAAAAETLLQPTP